MEHGYNRNNKGNRNNGSNDRRNFGKGRDFKNGASRRDTERERVTEELDETVVIGRNAVKELLSGGRDVDKLYITSGEREGSINQLLGIAAERGIPITECDRSRLDTIAKGGRHQGIIAIAAERNYASIDEILEYASSKGEPPFVVVCDGVEDPHNLGAIIRSAECAGAHGIIIPKRRAVGLTATVAKSSAGALEHMLVAKVTNLPTAIDDLKERGLWIYAADMDGTTYYKTDMKGATALVLGSEGFGISRLVKEKCDFIVSIPLYGQVNSMNVSCAAAVLLAEVARQRNDGEV
jgi:23S rRNA (guanosine2251-2'-O)-methyltransferase